MLRRGRRVRVPERERHAHDLARLGESHPLHPIAVACIQDSPEDRLSAVVLCERLGELKLSPLYKLFPSIGKSESMNTIVMSSAGVFSNVDQAGASHQLEAVTQAMQLVPPRADVQLMREERERAQVEAERLTHEKDELRAELDDIQQQRENLEEELGETHREKDTLRAELGDVQQQREELREELGETKREKDTLRAELEEAQQQQETLRAELEDTRREKDEAQASVVLVARERDTLHGELDEAKGNEVEARAESKRLRNEVERHRSAARVSRQRSAKASDDLNRLTRDRDGLRHEKEELQQVLGQLRHREEELREELGQTRRERDKASHDATEHMITLRSEQLRARQAREDAEASRARCEGLEKDQNQLDMMVSLARG